MDFKWTMFALVLCLIGGILFVAMLQTSGGNLGSMLEEFCRNWPEFCGQRTQMEEQIAKASMDMLVCAVNRVTTGNPDLECEIEDITSIGTGGGSILLPTYTTGSMILEPRIDDNPVARDSLSGYSVFLSSVSFQEEDADEPPVECGPGEKITRYDYIRIRASGTAEANSKCSEACDKSDYDCISSLRDPLIYNYHLALPINSDNKITMLKCECYYTSYYDILKKYVTEDLGAFVGNTLNDVVINCIDFHSREFYGYFKQNDLPLPTLDEMTLENCESVEVSKSSFGTDHPYYEIVAEVETAAKEYACYTEMDEDVNVKLYSLDGSEDLEKVCEPIFDLYGNQLYNFEDENELIYNGDYPDDGESKFLLLKYRFNKNAVIMEDDYHYEDNQIGFYDCKMELEIPTISCSVNDFLLPQTFEGLDKPKQWIEGFGDPEFLVYYEKFPFGEEKSWSGIDSWIKGSTHIMFAVMCLSSVISVVRAPTKIFAAAKQLGKAGKSAIKSAKAITKTAKALDTVTDITKYGDDVIRYASKADDVAKGLEIAKKFGTRFTVMSGAVALGTYAGMVMDGNIGKYFDEDKEGKMILQRPMTALKEKGVELSKNPATTQNPISTVKPILLYKEDKKQFVPFYLASPCEADLNVEMKMILCDYYQYDPTDSSVTCFGPDDKNDIEEYPECGLDRALAGDQGRGIYYSVMTMREHPKLVEYENGKLDKIYFPHLSIDLDKDVYYKVNQQLSGTEMVEWINNLTGNDPVEAWSYNKKVFYFLDLYYGNEKICSDINIMECNSQMTSISVDVCDENGDCESQFQYFPECSTYNGYSNLDTEEMGGGGLVPGDNSEKCLNFVNSNIFPYYDQWGRLETYTSNEDIQEMISVEGIEGEYGTVAPPVTDLRIRFVRHHITPSDQGGVFDFSKFKTFEFTDAENCIGECEFDGDWDWFTLTQGLSGDEVFKMYWSPSDEEGITETQIGQANCKIPAIVVTPDQDPYVSRDEYNFCYTRGRLGVSIALTAGEIALDAASMIIPGPIGMVAAIVSNCGLAAFENKETTTWPKGPSGSKG